MAVADKAQPKSRSNAHIQRSVLILVLALTLVVVISFELMDRSVVGDEVAASMADQNRRRADMLVDKGWRVYHQLNDHKQAELIFRRAIDISPYAAEAVNACGQMALVGKDYEEAYRFFIRYHDLAKKTPRSYMNLAVARLCLDKVDEAEQTLAEGMKTYLELQNDFRSNLVLATIYQRKQDIDFASMHFIRAMETKDGTPEHVLNIQKNEKWAAPLGENEAFQMMLKGMREQPESHPIDERNKNPR